MKKNLNLSSLLRPVSSGSRIHPARVWFFLLSVATALVMVSVAWNIWLLRSVEKGGTLGDETTAAVVDDAPTESVRAVFESREKEEAKYRSEYRFVDPSL